MMCWVWVRAPWTAEGRTLMLMHVKQVNWVEYAKHGIMSIHVGRKKKAA